MNTKVVFGVESLFTLFTLVFPALVLVSVAGVMGDSETHFSSK